ncbi:hypothetical protein [Pseudoalteromonas sp. MQS005]|uniref:hypothetical protein n=1 Tax=Pseudoalteromonas sp. MQS005 TaxID=1854052 RepID=UPI0007E4E14E|nr:hypothetical protein [Pseudoalteromonas sp. MQS005]
MATHKSAFSNAGINEDPLFIGISKAIYKVASSDRSSIHHIRYTVIYVIYNTAVVSDDNNFIQMLIDLAKTREGLILIFEQLIVNNTFNSQNLSPKSNVNH